MQIFKNETLYYKPEDIWNILNPYNVYGGLQDNGVWTGANDPSENSNWEQNGDYPWKRLLGGDGMQIQIDKQNTNIVEGSGIVSTLVAQCCTNMMKIERRLAMLWQENPDR